MSKNLIDSTMIRKDFPMLQTSMHGKSLIYLDSAATSQKPFQVIDEISQFYKNHYSTVHRAVYELAAYTTSEYQQTREKLKSFINAKKVEEIIYTKGTTEAINLVASSFGKAFVQKGDEILISEMEHHANIIPWQILCEERGAHLKVIPVTEKGDLDLTAFKKLLSHKTKLVAITHISNAIGTINPIKLIIDEAHEYKAKVLIDGAQAIAHKEVDVQELDVDFYVFSGHKMYGPTGIGVLYGKEDLLNAMPPYQGGGDMIDKVTFEKTTYNTLPLKFEAGTPPIAEVIGLSKAIDYLQNLELNKIAQHEEWLLEYATTKLKEIPNLTIFGDPEKKAAIISFTIAGIHPLDIGTMLDLKGVAIRTGHLCCQPLLRKFDLTAVARASFALYNTTEEIDLFVQYLKEVISLLKN